MKEKYKTWLYRAFVITMFNVLGYKIVMFVFSSYKGAYSLNESVHCWKTQELTVTIYKIEKKGHQHRGLKTAWQGTQKCKDLTGETE